MLNSLETALDDLLRQVTAEQLSAVREMIMSNHETVMAEMQRRESERMSKIHKVS